jgi:hypothetical protein
MSKVTPKKPTRVRMMNSNHISGSFYKIQSIKEVRDKAVAKAKSTLNPFLSTTTVTLNDQNIRKIGEPEFVTNSPSSSSQGHA